MAIIIFTIALISAAPHELSQAAGVLALGSLVGARICIAICALFTFAQVARELCILCSLSTAALRANKVCAISIALAKLSTCTALSDLVLTALAAHASLVALTSPAAITGLWDLVLLMALSLLAATVVSQALAVFWAARAVEFSRALVASGVLAPATSSNLPKR